MRTDYGRVGGVSRGGDWSMTISTARRPIELFPPYMFETPQQLLEDFFAETDRVIRATKEQE